MKCIFRNIIGVFVFNESFSIVDKILFEDPLDSDSAQKELFNRHKDAKKLVFSSLDENSRNNFFKSLNSVCERADFVKNSMAVTKKTIKNAVSKDIHIIQAIKNIEDFHKDSNMLAKRLREWYGYYSPEIVENIEDHKTLAESIISKSRDELLRELNLCSAKDSMGADFSQNLLEPIMNLAHHLLSIYKLIDKHTEFLDVIMQDLCPNTVALCGTLITAKLIDISGSLRRLAILPASTIQTLGAEKALFRHLRSNSRPPKHGVIIQHPLVAKAKRQDRGRVARALANKIALTARVDYNSGDPYYGFTVKEELEKKFNFKE